MSVFWKIFVAVVITAAVVGVAGYYFMNKKSNDDKAKLQTQIDNLNEELKDLKAGSTAPTSSTITPAASATTSWKNYTNPKYGFSLTFNDLWKNFEIVSKSPGADDSKAVEYLYICIPTATTSWQDEKAGMFCPMVITVAKIADKSKFEDPNDLNPTYIGENSSYAFYYSSGQANPDDGLSAFKDVKNIIATFKAN